MKFQMIALVLLLAVCANCFDEEETIPIPRSSAKVKSIFTTTSNEEIVIERVPVDIRQTYEVVEGSGEEGSGEDILLHRPPIKRDCKRRYTQMWQCYADGITAESETYANVTAENTLACVQRQCPAARFMPGDQLSYTANALFPNLNLRASPIEARLPEMIEASVSQRCVDRINADVKRRSIACVNKKYEWFGIPELFPDGDGYACVLTRGYMESDRFMSLLRTMPSIAPDCYLSKLCPMSPIKARGIRASLCQRQAECIEESSSECGIAHSPEMRAFVCDCVGGQSERLREEAIDLLTVCLNAEQSAVVLDAQALYALNSKHRLVNRALCLGEDPFHRVDLCLQDVQRSPPRNLLPSISEFVGEYPTEHAGYCIGESAGMRQLAVKGAEELTDTSNWKGLWEVLAGRRPYADSSPVSETLLTAQEIVSGKPLFASPLGTSSGSNLLGVGRDIASLLTGNGGSAFASPRRAVQQVGQSSMSDAHFAEAANRIRGQSAQQRLAQMTARQMETQRQAEIDRAPRPFVDIHQQRASQLQQILDGRIPKASTVSKPNRSFFRNPTAASVSHSVRSPSTTMKHDVSPDQLITFIESFLQ